MTATSTRLHGDTRTLVVAVTALVAILGIVSFTAGIPGLMAVGEWALLPGWMSALVPVIVDGGILVFSLVAVVRRARGEGSFFAWSCLAILTLGSVAAQVAHVLLGSGSVVATAIAGAVVAGAFPSVVFASTHAILDLAIAPAPKRGKHAEQVVEQAPEQTPEPQAFILTERPVSRPAVDAKPPARRVERDAETVLPVHAEQPAKVTAPVPVADAEQVPVEVAREVPERVEQDVPESAEQVARPVPEAPARPAPSTPARKAPSTRPSVSSVADEQSREQAVNAVLAGMPKAAAAREFGVARATLQRAVAAAEAEREHVAAA